MSSTQALVLDTADILLHKSLFLAITSQVEMTIFKLLTTVT